MYHIDSLGNGGWVTAAGPSTSPVGRLARAARRSGAPAATGATAAAASPSRWPPAAGPPAPGARTSRCPASASPPGASLPLRYYQSIAVDPSVIPLGSRVYVPAYRHDGHGGWFIAQDTGGAINGRHIDVYRSPPASADDSGQYLTGQRIYVIKPAPLSRTRSPTRAH